MYPSFKISKSVLRSIVSMHSIFSPTAQSTGMVTGMVSDLYFSLFLGNYKERYVYPRQYLSQMCRNIKIMMCSQNDNINQILNIVQKFFEKGFICVSTIKN